MNQNFRIENAKFQWELKKQNVKSHKKKKRKKNSLGTWELKNKFSIAAIWSSEFQNKYLKEFWISALATKQAIIYYLQIIDLLLQQN